MSEQIEVTSLDQSLRFRDGPFDPVKSQEDANLFISVLIHGIQNPLVALKRLDGRMTLTSGYRRLDAAIRAGHTHVPVVVVRG